MALVTPGADDGTTSNIQRLPTVLCWLFVCAVKEVEAVGELANTYIIYTGDNGYHLGAHRLGAGKETPYQVRLQAQNDTAIESMAAWPG